jgi:hypothetical protein
VAFANISVIVTILPAFGARPVVWDWVFNVVEKANDGFFESDMNISLVEVFY